LLQSAQVHEALNDCITAIYGAHRPSGGSGIMAWYVACSHSSAVVEDYIGRTA
jgi:hypothetical protein